MRLKRTGLILRMCNNRVTKKTHDWYQVVEDYKERRGNGERET